MDFVHFRNIIDGQQRGSKTFHQGIDPSSQKLLWDVPIASAEDLEDAVRAARKAFGTWSTLPVEERQDLIVKLRQALLSRHEEMTKLLMTEVGKPVSN